MKKNNPMKNSEICERVQEKRRNNFASEKHRRDQVEKYLKNTKYENDFDQYINDFIILHNKMNKQLYWKCSINIKSLI